MRIISGTHGGRKLKSPKGRTTRPTSDRVREATFSRLASIIGDLTGTTALDAYAGSGAMGFEALSRGAGHVTFVERDGAALKTLRENTEALGLGANVSVLRGDTAATLSRAALPGSPFGLLILDPPYRIENAEVREVIGSLVERRLLAPACFLVWEHPTEMTPEPNHGWSSCGTKTYGTTSVTIFKADAESDQ